MTRIILFILLGLAFGKCNTTAQAPQSVIADCSYKASFDDNDVLGTYYTGFEETTYVLHYDARESRLDIYEAGRDKVTLDGVKAEFSAIENFGVVKRKWVLTHPDFGRIIIHKTDHANMVEAYPNYGVVNHITYYSRS